MSLPTNLLESADAVILWAFGKFSVMIQEMVEDGA